MSTTGRDGSAAVPTPAPRRSTSPSPTGAQYPLIAGEAVGQGAWTRRQVVVLDEQARIRVWARVHDRAAGRTNVDLTADPELERGQEQELAGILLAWACWQHPR